MSAGQHYKLNRRERRLKLLPTGEQTLWEWSQEQSGLWCNTRYREQLVTQALRALPV